ncbi:MAG: protein kinase domain-containing protein [Kiritimatiellia bacterium]
MSQFLTILVLAKDTAIAQKVLVSDRTILVPVSSMGHFRHFIAQAACDVWLCDLSMEGLNFRADAELVRLRNPNTRVVLTGPAFMAGPAAAILQQGEASVFVAKPWKLLALRQAIFRGASCGEASATGPAAVDADTTEAGTSWRPTGQANRAEIKKAANLTGRITLHMGSSAESTHAAGMTGRIAPHTNSPEKAPDSRPGIRLAPITMPANKPDKPPPPVSSIALQEPRYRLDELLGEGGVGKVYLAYDLLLETKVAIKILKQDFVRDPGVLQALKREAKICMQLTHPHIVRFYDFGQRSGTYFLVLEYVAGQTLYEAMQAPASREHSYIRNVAAAVCSALSYAHSHGVLHNDITPGNIIIGTDGMLRLIDFGIASAATQHRERTAFIFGTPAYMSPEQLRCDPVLNATADVFALGVLLHQMLTGLLPQPENATNEELALHPRPPITKLPTPLAAVLDRALAFDPARRWRTIAELAAAFDSALDA